MQLDRERREELWFRHGPRLCKKVTDPAKRRDRLGSREEGMCLVDIQGWTMKDFLTCLRRLPFSSLFSQTLTEMVDLDAGGGGWTLEELA